MHSRSSISLVHWAGSEGDLALMISTCYLLSSQIAAEIEDIRLTGRLQELIRSEKQQGAELQQLYNRSLALLQSISDGLLAIDKKGYVEEINAVAAGILGRPITAGERILADELVDDKPPSVLGWQMEDNLTIAL